MTTESLTSKTEARFVPIVHRTSHPDLGEEGTWVDGYVFPTAHEFTVDRKRRRTEDQRSPACGRDRTCDLAHRGVAPVHTSVSGSLMVADPLVIAYNIRVLFPSTHDPVSVNSPYKHGRSIQIRPRRCALGRLDGRESYVLRSHAAEMWQTKNMRLWNATHSNFGPATIWELSECETIPIKKIERMWQRHNGIHRAVLRRRNGPHVRFPALVRRCKY